jgi:hypothetical protein
MDETRATTFTAYKKFLAKHYGSDSWDKLVSSLSPEDQLVIKQSVPISWIDLEVKLRLSRAMDSMFGNKDGALLSDFARFEAELDLNSAQRIFLRFANPAYLLEKGAQLWSRYHNWGKYEVERISKTSAKSILHGNNTNDPLFCHQHCGYIQRLVELVGGKNVIVVHAKCTSKGNGPCEFVVTWEK